MVPTPSPFTVVVLASAAIGLAVGVAALRRRPDPMAWPLAALMFAVAAWAVPHAVSFEFAAAERVALLHRLRYPGTTVAPVAYLVLAVRYAGHDRLLSRRVYAALGVVPAITVAAVWTNPLHGLFWRSLAVERVAGATVFVPEFGPWYWVNLGYLYLVTAAGLALFGLAVARSGPIYRKQAGLIFLGGLVPLAANVAVNAGLGPPVDFTTTALAATGLTTALALFRFDLLEVRPVARDRLVEELDDGVVVVGPDGRIRDFNPTAERVLGDLAVDQPAAEVLPETVAPDGGEIAVETPEGTRLFRPRSHPLDDDPDGDAGRIVYLNDVTDLVERERRVSVLNRVLRHNVRNELNVADARVEMVRERATPPDSEDLAAASESIGRAVEFADRARDLERAFRRSDAPDPVALGPVVERVVADARGAFPDATVEYDRPAADLPPARVADPRLFEMAVAELVENAVVHDDRPPARVTVRVGHDTGAGPENDGSSREPGSGPDGGRVRVHVADEGPGVPETEREALAARTEGPLEHGSGLGLQVAQWAADLSGGELSVAENDPRGSVVTLSLPVADR